MEIKLLYTGMLVLWLMPLPCGAEVYKSVDEYGRVIFSDRPPQEASSTEAVTLDPGPDEARRREAQAREAEIRAAGARAEERINARIALRERLQRAVELAKDKLAAAQQALRQGKTPKAGERLAVRGGASRFAPQYHERVAALQQAVEAARYELEVARRNLQRMSEQGAPRTNP
jgi:hypothetical protein